MVGSKLSTPVMSKVRRPSDIGLKSGAGSSMCLPSPQVRFFYRKGRPLIKSEFNVVVHNS